MSLDSQELPHILVSACLEVHKHLGAVMTREAYRECLALELKMREIVFQRDVPAPIFYKGQSVADAVSFDFVVEGQCVLDVQAFAEDEARAKEKHKERLTTWLKLSRLETALLINFHAADLRKGGIKRLIVSASEPSLHYQKGK